MNSNYSVLPKSSYIELQQLQNDSFESLSPQNKVFVSDQDSYVSVKNIDDIEGLHDDDGDGDDFDIDNYPNVVGGSNAGVPGAVFNLTTSIIGAGMMALPATMKVLGLVLGFALIIVMGVLSEISLELLVRFSVLCKVSSYGEVVQCALGRTGRALSEICIILNTGGVLIVYLIIMGDVMSGSLHHVGVFDQWLGNGFWDHRKMLIFVVLVVFLAPLCALDRIDSLSVTSAASVALAVEFVVLACGIASVKVVEGIVESPKMSPDLGSKEAILNLLVVIPVMTNAYVCHFNVQPIYNELVGRSPQKMNKVGRWTTVICVVIYVFTAISGYLLFGNDTEADILTNFDKDLGIPFSTALNYIVRVGYVFHLVLVFPVIHFSLRQTVDALVFDGAAPLSESRKRCLALTAVLLLLIYIGSTMIPNIWTAFKFTGATTAVSLGFIFPSLIALKLGHPGASLSLAETYLSWFMLILAIFVSFVGVVGNIYSIKK